jgi:hypothetical protein
MVRGYGLYSGNQHSCLREAFVALGSQLPTAEPDKLDVVQWLVKLGRDPQSLCCPECGQQLEIPAVANVSNSKLKASA